MDEPAATALSSTTLFSVLGPVAVSVDGVAVRLGGPRQVAVLAHLLVSAGHVVSMAHLVEGVWDGDCPSRPDVTIRSYLSNLRRTIEPWRLKGDRRSCIESTSGGYRLAIAPETLDAHRFEQAIVEGRRAVVDQQYGVAVEYLAAGNALWRGEPYEGLVETDAMLAARSRLGELRLVSTELLAEARLGQGEHGTVIADLEAALAEHPLRERLTELSMLALYRAGRQSEALVICAQLRAQLVDRQGLDPGPRIQELEAKILTHDVSLLQLSSETRPTGRPAITEARPELVVGRSREQAALAAVGSALAQGRGSTALITGEPGSGKSVLVANLCDTLGLSELVAWGRCRAVAAEQVLWPWGQVVDTLVAELPAEVLDGLESLTDLAPAWAAARDPSTASRVEVDPSQHFQTIVELLRRASRLQPVVVVMEDAHQADEASIELLLHAGAALSDHPVAFVVTWRHTQLGRPRARHALRQLVRMPSMVRVELEGLDRLGVGRLVAATDPGFESLIGELHEATAGNPLLVGELIAGLIQRRGGPDHEPPSLQPTTNLREVVLERVERTHVEAVKVLVIASLCGPVFCSDVIADATGLSRHVVEEVLDAGVACGLLSGVDDGEWSYRFVHPITAQVLIGELNAPRRARLHAALGHTCWRQSRPAAEVARHFALVGSTGTSILAARFALQSVATSSSVPALSEAAEIVELGLAGLDRLDNIGGLEVDFCTYLAHWARLQGDRNRFEALAERGLEAARRRDSAHEIVQASMAATGRVTSGPSSMHLTWLGLGTTPVKALDIVDGAPEPDDGGVEMALTLARETAVQALALGTGDERLAAADDLIQLLDEDELDHDRVLAGRLRVAAWLGAGTTLEAEQLVAQAGDDCSESGPSLLWLDVTVLTATVDLYQGRLEAAGSGLEAAVRFCRRTGLDPGGSIDHLLLVLQWVRGAMDLSTNTLGPEQWRDEASMLAVILADSEAEPSAGSAGGIVGPQPVSESPAALCRRIMANRLEGGTQDASALTKLLRWRSTIIMSSRGLVMIGPGSYYAAHAALGVGDIALAVELLDETEEHARSVRAPSVLARALRLRAEIGTLQRDRVLVDTSLAEVDRLGSPAP